MFSCLGTPAGSRTSIQRGLASHGQQQHAVAHPAQPCSSQCSSSLQQQPIRRLPGAAAAATATAESSSAAQQERAQTSIDRRQQQQQQQHHHHSSKRYNIHPASVVGSSWGVAERRAQLAALVRAADSVNGLAGVWLRCRAAAGPAEVTVLFNRLAAVCEPRKMNVKGWNNAKALLRDLLITSEDKMQLMAGPEFVYIIAALAKLRAAPDQAWLNRWLAVSRHKLSLLSPSQLVMCTRALCRLDMQPGDVKACIAFPAWMHNYLQAVHAKLGACSAFELTRLVRSLADLGYKPARPFLNEFAAAVEPKLAALDSINLATLMGAFSALKYEPEPDFMKSFYAEVYQKLPLFDDQDLATALCAFSSMRKLMKGDFLAEFLSEVAEKLPVFGTPELASVLTALGQLQYQPSTLWTTKVADHLQTRLQKANIHTISSAAWGLAQCGHKPSPAFIDDLIAASIVKLSALDASDAVLLLAAVAKFEYRPKIGSKAQRPWLKWFERFCFVLDKKALHPKQVMSLLESFAACQVTPEPHTVDHLVLQLVQGGLQHAPVQSIATLLQLLADTDYNPGPLFMKNYAYCLQRVFTSFTPNQMANALKCLAAQASFVPNSWWIVRMLADTHSRVTLFSAPAAAVTLWAAAKLTKNSKLPSEKWTADFSRQFWDHVITDITEVEQLGQGLWGSIMIGFSPSEDQWQRWEAAAAANFQWGLPLPAARDAVQGYRTALRPVPVELLDHLEREVEIVKARQAAEVAAAEQARQRAAALLALQQQRVAAAVAQYQASQGVVFVQQQQNHDSSGSSSSGSNNRSKGGKKAGFNKGFNRGLEGGRSGAGKANKQQQQQQGTHVSSSSSSSSSSADSTAALVAVPA